MKHQLGGALQALAAAEVQQAAVDGDPGYFDGEHVALEGARSDKRDLLVQILIKAIRTLNERVRAIATATTLIDVDNGAEFETSGLLRWATFKVQNAALRMGLQGERKRTVAGPFGGRTGATTGSFETTDVETKQQVHICNVPTGAGPAMAVARWQFHPEVVELDSDGNPIVFGEWVTPPSCREHPMVEGSYDYCDGSGDDCRPKPGVPHERAGEEIAMWRLCELSLVPDSHRQELSDLFDAVHMAQQELKADRRREAREAAESEDVMTWDVEVDDFFGK